MTISISQSILNVDDPDAAIAFYRDGLGMQVLNDVAVKDMRWVTVGSPQQPDVQLVLQTVTAYVDASQEDRDAIADLLAKGVLGFLVLNTDDVDAAFERLVASGAEVVQEPAQEHWGVRGCAFRDPAGNLIRIHQPAG